MLYLVVEWLFNHSFSVLVLLAQLSDYWTFAVVFIYLLLASIILQCWPLFSNANPHTLGTNGPNCSEG